MRTRQLTQDGDRGFSLIELMVVIVMISLVMAAVLSQVRQVQQRSTAEQGRVDDFQQARDFMAQVVRDGRQMGYPNSHNYDLNATPSTVPGCIGGTAAWVTNLVGGLPMYYNDCRMAAGLIKLTPTELDFGGDMDGSGNVEIVSYKINGDGACANCMERAQVNKANGSPLTQATTIGNYVEEVQNVQNAGSATAPIFSAFNASGGQIVLGTGIDMIANPATVAQVRAIRVNLDVANPTSVDPQTKKQLESDITGTIQIVNCSMATTQATLAAAGITSPGYVNLACQP